LRPYAKSISPCSFGELDVNKFVSLCVLSKNSIGVVNTLEESYHETLWDLYCMVEMLHQPCEAQEFVSDLTCEWAHLEYQSQHIRSGPSSYDVVHRFITHRKNKSP
jgi:hypothetical protein